MRYAPREGETLEAWDGGPLPGWSSNVSQSSSTRTWWHDESLLAEALQQIRDEQWDQRHADDDDAEDGASSSEPDAEPDE
jgi:hypothetical protein